MGRPPSSAGKKRGKKTCPWIQGVVLTKNRTVAVWTRAGVDGVWLPLDDLAAQYGRKRALKRVKVYLFDRYLRSRMDDSIWEFADLKRVSAVITCPETGWLLAGDASALDAADAVNHDGINSLMKQSAMGIGRPSIDGIDDLYARVCASVS